MSVGPKEIPLLAHAAACQRRTADPKPATFGVIDLLLQHQLLSQDELSSDAFSINDSSRRNYNLRISSETRGYFVKTPLDADGHDSLAHEAAVYRYCQTTPGFETVSSLQPKLILHKSNPPFLITQLQSGF
jgi:hypothetical protein